MSSKSNLPMILGAVGVGGAALYLMTRPKSSATEPMLGEAFAPDAVDPEIRAAMLRAATGQTRRSLDGRTRPTAEPEPDRAGRAQAREGSQTRRATPQGARESRGYPAPNFATYTYPSEAVGTFPYPANPAEVTFNPSRTALSFGAQPWGLLYDYLEDEWTNLTVHQGDARAAARRLERLLSGGVFWPGTQKEMFAIDIMFPRHMVRGLLDAPGEARRQFQGALAQTIIGALKGRIPNEILRHMSVNRQQQLR